MTLSTIFLKGQILLSLTVTFYHILKFSLCMIAIKIIHKEWCGAWGQHLNKYLNVIWPLLYRERKWLRRSDFRVQTLTFRDLVISCFQLYSDCPNVFQAKNYSRI